ncbi:nucleoside-diphosphate sugar epimerase, partial [Mesorhizobium sp. M7A.F.Ca.US.007.01.2.1]|uniref:DoxX-like family protein n=1 Tax=Mesorhizobium sp. M7A.F.Ca.US.007.01.2.1 TaxID=2496711 RepID=UPI000FD37CFF
SGRSMVPAIAVALFYAIAGTMLRPELWNEPLGPFLKILPILVLHFVALAVLEER